MIFILNEGKMVLFVLISFCLWDKPRNLNLVLSIPSFLCCKKF